MIVYVASSIDTGKLLTRYDENLATICHIIMYTLLKLIKCQGGNARTLPHVTTDLCNQIELLASYRNITLSKRHGNKVEAKVASTEIGDIETDVRRGDALDLSSCSGSGGCSIKCGPYYASVGN